MRLQVIKTLEGAYILWKELKRMSRAQKMEQNGRIMLLRSLKKNSLHISKQNLLSLLLSSVIL